MLYMSGLRLDPPCEVSMKKINNSIRTQFAPFSVVDFGHTQKDNYFMKIVFEAKMNPPKMDGATIGAVTSQR